MKKHHIQPINIDDLGVTYYESGLLTTKEYSTDAALVTLAQKINEVIDLLTQEKA